MKDLYQLKHIGTTQKMEWKPCFMKVDEDFMSLILNKLQGQKIGHMYVFTSPTTSQKYVYKLV